MGGIVRESLEALRDYIEQHGLSEEKIINSRADFTPI